MDGFDLAMVATAVSAASVAISKAIDYLSGTKKERMKMMSRMDSVETTLCQNMDVMEINLNKQIEAVEAKLNERINVVEHRLGERIDDLRDVVYAGMNVSVNVNKDYEKQLMKWYPKIHRKIRNRNTTGK